MTNCAGWMLLLAAGAAAALGGCRAYEARPLDESAHRAAWLSRDPAEGAAAFAARLNASDGGVREFDVSDGVTLEEAEAVCLVFNGDLRVARSRAGVAAAAAGAAGLWEDPVLGVDLARILGGVDHPWEVVGFVSFTIPLSGRLDVQKALAEAEYGASLLEALEAEQAALTALRRAWAEWSAATAKEAAVREGLEAAEGVVSIVTRLEEAGELTRVEARALRIEAASERAELRRLAARAASSRREIVRLIGLAPDASVELVVRLVGTGRVASEAEAGLENNPALAASRARYEAREQALRLEVREQYPDLVIGPGFGEEDADSRVVLGISAPLPTFNANRLGIERAAAERERARVEHEALYESLASEGERLIAELEAASEERALIETELAPLVDEQVADVRRAAELGEVDAPLLLNALSRRAAVKARLVDAMLAEAVLTAELRAIDGEPVRTPAAADGGAP